MDLSREALQYIVGLDKAEIIDVGGQKYSTKGLSHIKLPSPTPFTVTTLTGLVDYLKSNIDKLNLSNLIVHVQSPTNVTVFSKILDDAARHTFIEAKALLPRVELGSFLNVEAFIILLQSGYLDRGDRSKILSLVGNIKEETVRTTGDDGISQTVTARAGIAKVADVVVPNPVILAPYRTFLEVEQPESKFVFRMKDGPQAALIEADGGAWKIEAMEEIKEYLEAQLADIGISIIS